MILPHREEEKMTPEEQENLRTDEIMGIYKQKYGKKSLFDDLWAQNHPEEARQLERERRAAESKERIMLQ